MVHLPVDPRLLTNLLADEKEYHKHLIVLLDTYAHHSQLSLSAYASASPTPVARAVIAVAGSLAGADDALRRYAQSIDASLTEMLSLKELEDEITRAIRDRDVLVARLFRRSKNATRGSVSGTLSSSSTKVDEAHAELQSSEADLAAKQRKLDSSRMQALRKGMGERCKGMVACGKTWMEMGQAGLRVIEGIQDTDECKTRHSLKHFSSPYTLFHRSRLRYTA
ncbi:hypothetical protein BV25DRAFT_1806084 [Artomyces pyxidatus]|uniref:Uncharacterized protein n=1 Tax=Artomyces pyxidatus TaxID=48021 RepID=A0ACB8SXB7_9AGAM|nr:hypothetical protein BV25DRAFT_1806084 [Artomyces pyxidatus]